MHYYTDVIRCAEDLQPILRCPDEALVLAAVTVHCRNFTRTKLSVLFDHIKVLRRDIMKVEPFSQRRIGALLCQLYRDGFLVRIGTQWVRPNTLLEALATVAAQR